MLRDEDACRRLCARSNPAARWQVDAPALLPISCAFWTSENTRFVRRGLHEAHVDLRKGRNIERQCRFILSSLRCPLLHLRTAAPPSRPPPPHV